MKSAINKALLILLFMVVNFTESFSNQSVYEDDVTLTVFGMRCVGCEFGIEREVGKLKGVVSVKADGAKNTVTVKYKKNIIKIDTIIDKINELGYRVEMPFK